MPESIRQDDFLEVAAKAVGLGALLLPIAGVVTRWVAFNFGTLAHVGPTELALSEPIGLLVATGLFSLIPMGYAIFTLVSGALTAQPKPEPITSRTVWLLTLFRVLLRVGFLLWLFAFFPSWPLAPLAMGGGFLASYLLRSRIRRAGRLILADAWPAVGVALLYAAAIWGLAAGTLSGVAVRDFHFRSEVGDLAHDGRYAQLGQAGGTIYVEDCTRPGSIIALEASAVIGSRLEAEKSSLRPSLWDVISSGAKVSVGYQSPC